MASAPTPADLELAAQSVALPLPWLETADRDRLAQIDWSAAEVEEGGQFHRVLVAPGQAVLRMTRTPAAAGLLPRRMALLDALAAQEPPLALPRALTEVSSNEKGTAAVVQDYVPGTAHPPHTGDPAVLRALCAGLTRIDTTALRPLLAEPFAFRGPWSEEKTAAVALLPQVLAERWPHWFDTALEGTWVQAVEAITTTVRTWTQNPAVAPSLVHGDLAGHNMHWAPVGSSAVRSLQARHGAGLRRLGLPDDGPLASGGWVLLGILDWDLAAEWDPALNPAYLSLWHGEEKLDAIAADRFEAQRGRVWLGAMALESLYDASLREGTPSPARWGKLLRKTLPRIGRAVNTLRDLRTPAGAL